MAAWQGREEPSARQGSKLDPTPASGGVPSGGLVGAGGLVGRQVVYTRSGRPQQEETAALAVPYGSSMAGMASGRRGGGVLPVTSLQETTR